MLDKVVTGKIPGRWRVILFGPEGVGKSTFGSECPKPIFSCAENGTEHLDVSRFPAITKFEDVLEQIEALSIDQHDYETWVLDSVDWVYPMFETWVGRKLKWSTPPGYGRDMQAYCDEWRVFLRGLEILTKKMNVLLIAHATVKQFKNPEGEDWHRYELALPPKISEITKQWPQELIFCEHERLTKETADKKIKGVTGGRVMHTERTAAFDAKRHSMLAGRFPFSYQEFASGIAGDLRREFEALLGEVAEEKRAPLVEWVKSKRYSRIALEGAIKKMKENKQ